MENKPLKRFLSISQLLLAHDLSRGLNEQCYSSKTVLTVYNTIYELSANHNCGFKITNPAYAISRVRKLNS